ncbi:hypothetical protein N7533_009731 [Penicillium manginii]|uniref:uncharacterized protein n=1 Tax=Penicillium manginii TaxID=203109 RepID=UPI00254815FD|nr:uncharacterized protein N7533_009731 [Penicillium manginii]KAJ5744861.1 hypothetical protein N7533_009731 [Penicillium manginii]
MSKKFKSQASSSRAAAGAFGSFGGFSGNFGSDGREPSALTYIAEPPDLSRISEQTLVISFKNLLKKDDITRTKALEELKEHVLSVDSKKGTLHDGFLEAWGSISGLVGKRIAPHLPKVIGAWLAGLYDNDKPVHRAALESFISVFSTQDKRNNVWKIYQNSILDFVDDVLLHQSPLTLSDERTVKRDDAEAKYARVSKRLFILEPSVISRATESSRLKEVFEKANISLLDNCLQVLRSRNGKPYGAAGVVEECVRRVPSIAKQSKELLSFLKTDAPELLFSPSGDRLITIILACRQWEGFSSCFEVVVERALELDPKQSNAHVLQSLLSTIDFNEVEYQAKLSSLVMRALDKACRGSATHWPIVTAVLRNQTSWKALMDQVFLSIIESLSTEDRVFEALHGLSQLGSTVPAAVREFQGGSNGSKLTGKLLYLTESPSEEVAALAESLMKNFKETVVGDTSTKSKIEILQNGFSRASEESLTIDSLVAIAEELLPGLGTNAEATDSLKNVLPSASTWETAMAPFLHLPPRLSTAITSPLAGAVHLIQHDLSDSFKDLRLNIARDSAHNSAAFRLASFTIRILSSTHLNEHMDKEDLETLFYFIPLAVQLIDDDLSIENSNGILGLDLADQRDEYVELVFKGRRVISDWVHTKENTSYAPQIKVASSLLSFWESKLEGLSGTSPLDYRIGEAFVKIMGSVETLAASKSADDVATICRSARTANAIRSAAWFVVLRSSILSNPIGNRICNELVADSSGLKPQSSSPDGLRKLALLNILLSGEENVVSTIPTQRLVFLTKPLIECLQSGLQPLGLSAEIIKTLSFVLPALSEIYGSHWEDSMAVLSTVLKDISGGEEGLPLLVSSFRLFSSLKSMTEGESNDDLQDVWLERRVGLFNELAASVGKFGKHTYLDFGYFFSICARGLPLADGSTTYHQPRDVAVDLLRRLIIFIPIEKLDDVSEVFSLLTAHSRAVQRTAYTLLHRYIPHAQEQVSFDVALSKSAVSLPDELVSLLLETPTMQMVTMNYGDDKMWTSLRAYLLSWKVIFDHFSNASLPVQEYYAANIKENNVLIPLLEFMFDFLQKAHGKIIDPTRFDIQSFQPDESENAEKETQWLLVHLYYLSLRHLANMTKNWWIDTKKRVKGPVEGWTEKYISPVVAGDSMKGVEDWAATQDPNEERALTVKISPRTAEIIASIPVDEESPPRLHLDLPSSRISIASSNRCRAQPSPCRREEMEELAAHHPGSDYVCQW